MIWRAMVVAFLFLLPAPQAFSQIEAMRARVPKIVELKDKGLVGEQPDGLLGVVSANADAQSVVDAENKDRKEEYQKRAKSQGQPVETLMKVLGEARIRQEKSGRFIRNEAGAWAKKN